VDEGALSQIKTCAKTAVHAALMSDHHKGYAVPIGGVVAYLDAISPSGVGFDIACIAEDSLVTLADGRRIPIQDTGLVSALMGASTGVLVDVGPALGRKISTRETVAITLSSGDRLRLTPDHELLTPSGWRAVTEIDLGSHIAVSAFRGVLCAESAHPTRVAFYRLLGLVMGDGTLSGTDNRVSIFTSKDEDVPSIQSALTSLGATSSIHRRVRPNGSLENHIYSHSPGLHARMTAAGCPVGKKRWDRRPLEYILRLPLGLQAAWLSGLFSAEMTTPWALPTHICSPAVKQGGFDAPQLLDVLALSLAGFGFETSTVASGVPYKERQTYVLQVLGGQAEFVRLWRTIGFCFCAEKRREAARMMSIAWQRDSEVAARECIRDTVRQIRATGESIHRVHEAASRELGILITKSVALKAVYLERGRPRTAKRFTPYTDNEVVWATLTRSESDDSCPVYDIALGHDCHNFVANGVIVHNCGNKAVLTDALADDVRRNIAKIMDDVWRTISFGVGRINNERVEHSLFDRDHPGWTLPAIKSLKQMAANQLGTVGSGNHYVDIFMDELDRVWIGVHFGSRGFGHKIATHFLTAAGASDGMDVEPCVLSVHSQLGADYLEGMKLAGGYAYAGRDWVCERVASLLGATVLEEVHNHHNYAWFETHAGKKLCVVRKGATPAFPGQRGFVGGSMGDQSVILEGVESEFGSATLYSTVHGAGRVMGRMEAKGKPPKEGRWHAQSNGTKVWLEPNPGRPGKVTPEMMREWVTRQGVELRGAGLDESPHCYKRLPEVLAHHADSVRILHTLTPVGVAMAGANEFDPYRD
jgi:tRNA-splicing ligase RtcB (3'-phosphate/5'-hydroxy nucleic acid ligase)